ncbi:MAG: FAD-dependent oxidoreductase, partial [Planctomycetota bacterium]|nr:FAD-dependent oxidoreductase [Planctomycetota bacterium]
MKPETKMRGSVLVVGGGIGGTQAALDLAGAGFKVHLVEKETAIGGVMAQLDKTFPTNDCAMCTLAPRLVDAARNLNIEKITGAELEKLEGVAGNFKATVRRKARYIDLARCTGCAACVDKCPVRAANEFDMELVKRTAIYRRYPQAVPGGFAIDKQGVSPCRLACPAGVNAHAYVALIAQRRFAEALDVEKQANPFPAICGRICPHKCETDCTRNKVDQPVSIAALKRFLADWEARTSGAQGESRRMTGSAGEYKVGPSGGGQRPPGTEPIAESTAKGADSPAPSSFGLRAAHRPDKVAIIGSGPAGLACARQLALKG